MGAGSLPPAVARTRFHALSAFSGGRRREVAAVAGVRGCPGPRDNLQPIALKAQYELERGTIGPVAAAWLEGLDEAAADPARFGSRCRRGPVEVVGSPMPDHADAGIGHASASSQ
jgi:hypothetical protein